MKFLVSILLFCGLVGPAQAQVPAPMSKKASGYSLQTDTFIDALLKIATRFELPLAVEWVKTADTLQLVRFSQDETTAAAVLDAVVLSHQGYTWQLENGIVHVFPRTLLTDSRNPLNVRVSGFPKDPITVAGADAFLFNATNEIVRSSLRKVESLPGGGTERGFQNVGIHTVEHLTIDAGNDATVRDVLNKIILASKTKIWIATFPSQRTLTAKGYYEVTPMIDPKYVHTEDQPLWIFLKWGDPPWKRLDTLFD
jgi:hypothetical protein